MAYWGVAREQRIPITAAFNGAELLKAERERVSVSARSLPQWIRYRCGLPAALMANGNVEPRDLGVRRALERHTITFTVTPEEYAGLRDQASFPNGPGITVPQYVRTRCGFRVRHVSNPNTSDRDAEEDEAWEMLDQLGLKADDYFDQ